MPMGDYGAYAAPSKKKPGKKKAPAKSAYKGVDYKLKPKPGGSRQEDMGRNPYKAPGGKRQEDMARKPGNLRQEDMGRRSGPPAKRTGYSVPKQPKRPDVSKRQEDMARKPDGRRQEDMGRRSASAATAKYLGSAARYAVAYAKPKSSSNSMGGRRQEDMARRKPGFRQEDMGRGFAQKAPKPGRAAPKSDLRKDLRDMYPKKKRTPVKPRGNPDARYLSKPARGFRAVSKRPEDMARRRVNPRPQG